MKKIHFILILTASTLLLGCQSTIPKEALMLSATSLENRQMQSRLYEDISEEQVLATSVEIFQDLGAKISESETELGLIVGEKDRDAVETGQVVGAFLMSALVGTQMKYDTKQKIKFSLVTRPATLGKDDNRWVARLTIQRLVWNSLNQLDRVEAINDVEIYQNFFEKMDKALFLEKNI